MPTFLKSLLGGGLAAPLLLACAAMPDVHEPLPPGQPKVLLEQRSFGTRVLQHYSVETHVGPNGVRLRSLYARLCNIDATGELQGCKDSPMVHKLNRIGTL